MDKGLDDMAKSAPSGGEADKPAVILVHGAWHGGWAWDRVRPFLEADGLRVFATTLTGMAETSHLAQFDISLTTHVQDIAHLIKWHDLFGITLVGHSFGGFIITRVADMMPERVSSLVYLDAFVPENGTRPFNYSPPERTLQIIEDAAKLGGRLVPPPDPSFWGFGSGPDRDYLLQRLTPQPLRCFLEPIELNGAWEQVPNKTFVKATLNHNPTFVDFMTKLEKHPGWRVIKIDSGHEMMLTHPKQTAKAIAAAATRRPD
jgi:pimeloyl-ACP methyl ester carboxylesterase